MDENELLEKLQVFKSMLTDAQLRRAGFMARIEGLNAELLANGIRPERIATLSKEVADITAKFPEIQQEAKNLRKWSEENLPSEFHFTFDE
jgi:hypothetical protein